MYDGKLGSFESSLEVVKALFRRKFGEELKDETESKFMPPAGLGAVFCGKCFDWAIRCFGDGRAWKAPPAHASGVMELLGLGGCEVPVSHGPSSASGGMSDPVAGGVVPLFLRIGGLLNCTATAELSTRHFDYHELQVTSSRTSA